MVAVVAEMAVSVGGGQVVVAMVEEDETEMVILAVEEVGEETGKVATMEVALMVAATKMVLM